MVRCTIALDAQKETSRPVWVADSKINKEAGNTDLGNHLITGSLNAIPDEDFEITVSLPARFLATFQSTGRRVSQIGLQHLSAAWTVWACENIVGGQRCEQTDLMLGTGKQHVQAAMTCCAVDGTK